MGRYSTFCEVQGREADVLVDADYEKAEAGNGDQAGYVINAVVEEAECIMHLMSEYELDQLAMRLEDKEDDRGNEP